MNGAERLPDGRMALPLADWQRLVETNRAILDACVEYGRVNGTSSLNERVMRLLGGLQEDGDFGKRRQLDRQSAKLREPGFLGSPAAIRREMAQLYRESYAEGPDAAHFFTRLTWMLDCLLRAAQAEQKAEASNKAGQTEAE